MPVLLSHLTERQLRHGVYLEDGERLWRVLDAAEGHVKLEDCGRPDGLPSWLAVKDVLGRMRLVRPK